MKKLLIATAIAGSCGLASADTDICDYSTDFNVEINEQSVLFKKDNGRSFEFKGNQLFIDGEVAELSKDQQKAIAELQERARAMVPKIAEIAVEGAELGVTAATMVLTALFEDDQALQQELLEPIKEATAKIKENINKDLMNSKELEKLLDESFDEKFEEAIESAATKYASKIIGNIFDNLFSENSEELEKLEARMEQLEKNIEESIKVNATKLEEKAESLCQDIIAMDALDNQLDGVEGYPEDGLIQKDGDFGFKLINSAWNSK